MAGGYVPSTSLGGRAIDDLIGLGQPAQPSAPAPAQPSAPPLDLMLEAEKRGILPPDKQGLLDEARKRGLVPASQVTPQAQPETPRSPLEAAGRGILQGLSFNTSDELYAGANSLANTVTGGAIGSPYADALAAVRKGNHESEHQNPGSYIAGEIGGGVLPLTASYLATALSGGAAAPAAAGTTAATAAKAAQAAGLWSRMKAGAATGAKVGAAYGVGGAESDPNASLLEAAGNRVLGGAKGALAGLLVGGLIPPAGAVAGAVAKPFTNLAQAIYDPAQYTGSKLAEALQRDYPGVRSFYGAARAEKPELFADAGSTLADVGGKNVQGVMNSAYITPNAERETFKKALDARQKGQPASVEDQIGKDLGNPSTYYQVADKIAADRNAKAGPAFAEAWAGDIEPSAKLMSVFQTNDQGLYTRPTLAKIVGDVEKRLADEHGDAVTGLTKNPGRVLHEIKVELDDKIGKAKRATEMGTASSADSYDLRSLMSLKTQLMQGIEESGGTFPEKYLGALKQYGTDSGLKTALRDGANEALTIQPEEIARKLAKLSPPEQEMYRLGAARTLAENNRVGKATNDRIGRDWQSPDRDMRMQELLPQGSKAGFDDRLKALGLQTETRRAAQGGSQTAERLKQNADDMKPAEMINTVGKFAMTPGKAMLDAVGQRLNYLSGMTPEVAAQTLKMLAQPLRSPGASLTGTEKAIEKALNARALARMRTESLANGLTRGTTALVPQQRQR